MWDTFLSSVHTKGEGSWQVVNLELEPYLAVIDEVSQELENARTQNIEKVQNIEK